MISNTSSNTPLPTSLSPEVVGNNVQTATGLNDSNLAKLGTAKQQEMSRALKASAAAVQMNERCSVGRSFQFAGRSLAPPADVVSAVSKVLKNLHRASALLGSQYWSSLEEAPAKVQWQVMKNFFDAGQPINERVRVDSVASEVAADAAGVAQVAKASLVELEMHPGCDQLRPVLKEVALAAGMTEASAQITVKDLAESLKAASPNGNGKVRFVQWPDETQRDMSYVESTQRLIESLQETGVLTDVKQCFYNDAAADWEGAVCVPLFDFSKPHSDADQGHLLDLYEQGKINLYPAPIPLGKILPLFVTEFPDVFKSEVGFTDAELACFPKTISAKSYLEDAALREQIPFEKAFLKGVLTDGNSGSQDVYPLSRFETESDALAFVASKQNDGTGGWLIQHEVPRAKIRLLQTHDTEADGVFNKGSLLMRISFLDGQWHGGYSVLSAGEITNLKGETLQGMTDDRIIHATDNSALVMQTPPASATLR